MRSAEQVLTVAQMRAAEQDLIDGGDTVVSLMERAGKGCAEWIARIAPCQPITVLCGPGNNGGDGYVIARELLEKGREVTVVAPVEPRTEAAIVARVRYGGSIGDTKTGGALIDCLFGSGLTRPLDRPLAALLCDLGHRHAKRIAIDLPSGIEADSGRALNDGLPCYDVTLALGAWKFAHGLMPAMPAMGEQRLVPIGVARVPGAAQLSTRPHLSRPAADVHKYTRGLVLVVEGAMAGAAMLACKGAMQAGSGAVRLATEGDRPVLDPNIILRRERLEEVVADVRTGAVVIGCGLGREEVAREKLRTVLQAGRPSVIDADALVLLRPADIEAGRSPMIITPHGGEMAQLAQSFGVTASDKVEQASALAAVAGVVVVSKGPDTVIAAPGGALTLAPSPSSWLSVGGSGDVLAGIIAARLAVTGDAYRAACEGVWLHGEAARVAGPAFLATGLAAAVPSAIAACL